MRILTNNASQQAYTHAQPLLPSPLRATGSDRAALALRTPRWRQPRFNSLALSMLLGGGLLLTLLL